MTAQPDYAVPTGEFIAEWLAENEMNAAELSRRLGVSRKHVSELLSGKVTLSHEVAISLENVTGIPARRWNRIEALYQEDAARIRAAQRLEGQYERATAFPLAYLRREGLISRGRQEKSVVVRELARLFEVADLDALSPTWGHGAVAWRKAALAAPRPELLATWLRLGERAVDLHALAVYDEARLRGILPDLRDLSRRDPSTYIAEIVTMLASAGVGFCFVRPIPGLGVHGATRWIHGRPLIQLSLRGKTDDQLWFTLFHEIGHVLLHPRNGLYLADDDTAAAEVEADTFAAETLIPPDFATDLPRTRDAAAVRRLAERAGVSPGIVLGQAQHRTGDFAWGHHLKVRFEFAPPTT